MKQFDVVVAGASFAGLAFAKSAADAGLRVLVLERTAKVGARYATTGVLGPTAIKIIGIPEHLLLNSITEMDLYFPHGGIAQFSSKKPRYYMLDVPGVLRWMYERCSRQVEFIFSASLTNISHIEQEQEITFLAGGRSQSIRARYVCGADGPNSTVAKLSGLDSNSLFLNAIEWIVKLKRPYTQRFVLNFDYNLAPGYCSWLAPKGNNYVIGTAGFAGKYIPGEVMPRVVSELQARTGVEISAVLTKKAGIIPIGGPLQHSINSAAILVGDAGGFCGPFLANGIYTACYTGDQGGRCVGKYLVTAEENELQTYKRKTNYLHKHYQLRKTFNTINSQRKMELVGEMLSGRQGKKLLTTFLEERTLNAKLLATIAMTLFKKPKTAFNLWRLLI